MPRRGDAGPCVEYSGCCAPGVARRCYKLRGWQTAEAIGALLLPREHSQPYIAAGNFRRRHFNWRLNVVSRRVCLSFIDE